MTDHALPTSPVPPAADSPNARGVRRDPKTQDPRLWRDDGWTAKVIENEDDEGWAVAMIKDGEAEPALVGPWTMGRDKKNPKPLDANAFGTLVKTASEVLRRHEQQLHAMLHKSVNVITTAGAIEVMLDIVPDEDDPYAILSARDNDGEQLAAIRIAPDFKLDRNSAAAWIESGYKKPR
ncbi:MAG TPA: hypothetical protein VNX00_10440 [Herbaspirillum sp.]|nr:hypothetical protein [Herbaspirillum sp.]